MSLPTPFYDADGIVIYCGDCGDVLPALPKADLVLTDPPYGMSFQSNHRAVKHARLAGDDELPLDLIWLAISTANVAAYVFCRWDNIPQMPKPKSVIAWVKNNWSMGDLEHEHGRQWEACCFYPRTNHAFLKRIPDVIHADRTGNTLHPTEKPIALLGTIIDATKCETVLDPFCGSGTTLVAAKLRGLRAVGIEINEEYCRSAVERLRQGVLVPC